MVRDAIAGLEARKMALITGLWANDGLNDDKGTRQQALEDLEQQFDEARQVIYSGGSGAPDANEITKEDEENPFLKPAIEATRAIEAPRDDEGTVKEALDSDGVLDQI